MTILDKKNFRKNCESIRAHDRARHGRAGAHLGGGSRGFYCRSFVKVFCFRFKTSCVARWCATRDSSSSVRCWKKNFFYFSCLWNNICLTFHKKKVTPKVFWVLCVTSRFFTKNSSVFPLDDEAAKRRMSFFSPDRPVSVEKKKKIFFPFTTKNLFSRGAKSFCFSLFLKALWYFPCFRPLIGEWTLPKKNFYDQIYI